MLEGESLLDESIRQAGGGSMSSRDVALAAPKAEDERSLEARARAGDPKALEQIAKSELERVERLLLKLLGPRKDLDDLIQTVFLEAFKALPRFRGESKLSTFIGGITVRVARRAMRPSAWWRRRGPMPADPADESYASGPEGRVAANEQIARVRKALERISPKKTTAFLLWALEGMSPEEIAQMTGTSLSATRSRIYYAQKELKERAAQDPYLRELLSGDEP
jgi:RNA polymerase sigma-70 factor, ECF subfamily